MTPEGIISALVIGTIIGIIARIIVPSMQPIGCIMTILLGIVGAFAGLGVANYFGYAADWLPLFGTQILIAVILVAITAALFRKGTDA
jgi:uncharacterized membrane protein YeaQ/YmgE (transglycosylase-associated protein family)